LSGQEVDKDETLPFHVNLSFSLCCLTVSRTIELISILLTTPLNMEDTKVAETQVVSDHSSLEAGANQVGEKTDTDNLDLDHIGEVQGYVLDEATLRRQLGLSPDAKLKTAKDGKTVLIPQPTDDPRDPLNWPAWRKHITLLVICIAGAMGDYGSAAGAITLLPQAT
jgi:hypothetical protein